MSIVFAELEGKLDRWESRLFIATTCVVRLCFQGHDRVRNSLYDLSSCNLTCMGTSVPDLERLCLELTVRMSSKFSTFGSE